LMEINNHLVEKLVDTNASMFVIKSSWLEGVS
jgi:predicted aspartyl protease